MQCPSAHYSRTLEGAERSCGIELLASQAVLVEPFLQLFDGSELCQLGRNFDAVQHDAASYRAGLEGTNAIDEQFGLVPKRAEGYDCGDAEEDRLGNSELGLQNAKASR